MESAELETVQTSDAYGAPYDRRCFQITGQCFDDDTHR